MFFAVTNPLNQLGTSQLGMNNPLFEFKSELEHIKPSKHSIAFENISNNLNGKPVAGISGNDDIPYDDCHDECTSKYNNLKYYLGHRNTTSF